MGNKNCGNCAHSMEGSGIYLKCYNEKYIKDKALSYEYTLVREFYRCAYYRKQHTKSGDAQ